VPLPAARIRIATSLLFAMTCAFSRVREILAMMLAL
jgi:hypothetical protein